jgi:hypothetical protein
MAGGHLGGEAAHIHRNRIVPNTGHPRAEVLSANRDLGPDFIVGWKRRHGSARFGNVHVLRRHFVQRRAEQSQPFLHSPSRWQCGGAPLITLEQLSESPVGRRPCRRTDCRSRRRLNGKARLAVVVDIECGGYGVRGLGRFVQNRWPIKAGGGRRLDGNRSSSRGRRRVRISLFCGDRIRVRLEGQPFPFANRFLPVQLSQLVGQLLLLLRHATPPSSPRAALASK